jgi:hypothetical protein
MIVARIEPITEKLQDDLRRLFQSPGYSVLVQVAEAQVKIHECEALRNAAIAAKSAPMKMDVADAELQKAARYLSFLQTLNEFKETKSYVTVKLT